MALQGTLDTFPLADVLRLLAATGTQGRLRVSGGEATGTVWVDDGRLVAVDVVSGAVADDPVTALFHLLRIDDGEFSFEGDAGTPPPGAAVTPAPVEELLDDAEALLAEWTGLREQVPSLDVPVRLVAELPDASVTLDRAGWAAVVAVAPGSTPRRLAEALELDDLGACRVVKDLLDRGLAELAPRTARPGGASEAALAEEVAVFADPPPPPPPPPPTAAPPPPPVVPGSVDHLSPRAARAVRAVVTAGAPDTAGADPGTGALDEPPSRGALLDFLTGGAG